MSREKLVYCRTCGAQIAKSAKKCPKCGARQKKRHGFRNFILLLIVVGIVCFAYNSGMPDRFPGRRRMSANAPAAMTAEPLSAPTEAPATAAAPALTEASVEPTFTPEPTEASDEPTSTPEPTAAPQSEALQASNGGISEDFKAFMDSYESFMNEYCDFMESYNASDLTMLAKYATMMKRYAEFSGKADKYNEDNLNSEELKYYIDVMSRIEKRMIDASLSMQD